MLLTMRFTVKAKVDDHVVSASAKTPREALAKAIDWHVAKQLADVVIIEGDNVDNAFSVLEFAEKIAGSEGADEKLH